MNKHHIVVIDGETLSQFPWDGVVVNLAASHYVIDLDDPKWDIPEFDDLNEKSFFAKFDIKSQMEMGRKTTDNCLDWWKTLPQSVQDQLKPDGSELHPKTAMERYVNWLRGCDIDPKNISVWARGQDFDMIIVRSILYNLYGPEHADNKLPYKFTKQRDIRTWVSAAFADPNKVWIPLNISGFEQHNARHDVSRAMIEVVVSLGILQGKDIPSIVGE